MKRFLLLVRYNYHVLMRHLLRERHKPVWGKHEITAAKLRVRLWDCWKGTARK